jgi:hypothetical protein
MACSCEVLYRRKKFRNPYGDTGIYRRLGGLTISRGHRLSGFDADRSLAQNVLWRGFRQTTPLPAECRRRGRTKEINAMNVNSFGLDLAEEQILNNDLSDEALERAGGLENRAGYTIAMCSGLSSCPSAPA